MKDFDYYYNCFGNLNTAKMKGHSAPHKPLLLLSVLDLIEQGIITSNLIELSDALINRFKENTKAYLGNSIIFNPNIGYPFYHLTSEPFWKHLHKINLQIISAEEISQNHEGSVSKVAESVVTFNSIELEKPIYSIKGLRERYTGALIDKELFELLKNQDARAKLRTLLISRYLSNQPNAISKEKLLILTGFILNLYQIVG